MRDYYERWREDPDRYIPENPLERCPKCGGWSLLPIEGPLVKYECFDCHQRMDKRDYIEWAIKSFYSKINHSEIYEICKEGINEVEESK